MRNSWHAREIDYIREHYETCTYEQMGAALSRTRGAVYAKMRELGLHKRPGFSRPANDDEYPGLYGIGPFIEGHKGRWPHFRWQKCLAPASEKQKQPRPNRRKPSASPTVPSVP